MQGCAWISPVPLGIGCLVPTNLIIGEYVLASLTVEERISVVGSSFFIGVVALVVVKEILLGEEVAGFER